MAPATCPAIQASFLFVKSLWRRVHHAIYLVHRLSLLGIAVRVPAHTKLGTPASMSPPIDAISWVFA
jgi:hypothetical protein